MKDPLHC